MGKKNKNKQVIVILIIKKPGFHWVGLLNNLQLKGLIYS